MRLDAALLSVGGVAPTHVLLDRGVSRWELGKGVHDGRAMRIRQGVFAAPGADPAFVTAVLECSRLTCVSAASYYDLWRVRESTALHLSRPDAIRSGCVNHRTRTVPVHARLPLVGLVDVLVHVLRCRPPEESVPMVESALRRGDTVPSFLDARLGGRRNAPARAALAQVECTADSATEVMTRLLLRSARLDVRPQVLVTGVGRVDFLVEGFLTVEIDGAAFHSDRQALRRDRRRNNLSVIGGYSVLRFCYEDVMFRQDALLAQVLSALGPRPVR